MTEQEFLGRFHGLKGAGPQYAALCPAHGDAQRSLSIRIDPDGKRLLQCHAGCGVEAIVRAASLGMKDLFPEAPAVKESWKEIETYLYIDGNGNCAEKVRKESGTGKKTFLWRRLNSDGSYTFNRQGVGHVLYNAAAVKDATHVFVVEGEKDTNALAARGVVAEWKGYALIPTVMW